jgi:DNA-binding winged helix-turn-helix (wHTH) protein
MHSDSHSESLSVTAVMRFQMLDLTIDAGRQTVTRAGAELHVPKLSFDLLLALLRAAPNTVSVADLMERVWPRQVVGVKTVAQRIKLLRRALDDDAAQPRYLTGARRGYRIINTLGGTYRSLGRYLFAQITANLGRATARSH